MAFRVEIAPQAVVNSLVGLSGITWASDSKGFYAGVAADAGSDLIHGGKLAFVDYTIDRNVWMPRRAV
jgi:hypothetical protein